MYGLRVKNQYGIYQIDAVNKSYALRSKATVRMSGGYTQNDEYATTGGGSVDEIPWMAGDIMFVSTNLNVTASSGLYGEATVRANLLYQPPGAPSGTAEVYIFNTIENVPTSNKKYGLRVRHPNTGAVVYDSRVGALKIVENRFIKGNAIGISIQSTRKTAAALYSPYVRRYTQGSAYGLSL